MVHLAVADGPHRTETGLFDALHEAGQLLPTSWRNGRTGDGAISRSGHSLGNERLRRYNATSRKFQSVARAGHGLCWRKDSPDLSGGSVRHRGRCQIEGEPKVKEHSFRTGAGVRWGDSAGCLFCATGAFFRPGYVNNIVQNWLPALDGIEAKAQVPGAKVADVGCGVGFSQLC